MYYIDLDVGYNGSNESDVTMRDSSMDYTHSNYNRSSDADKPVRVGCKIIPIKPAVKAVHARMQDVCTILYCQPKSMCSFTKST